MSNNRSFLSLRKQLILLVKTETHPRKNLAQTHSTMPTQQEALQLVRKLLFYLSTASLILVLFSFTFSTASVPNESLSIYNQSFLPMPQIALNLVLLAFSLLHIKYALYFSSSTSPRWTTDSRDSGSGMASYLQFLSEYKYARHIRIVICLAFAMLLTGVSCYSYLVMLGTGNTSMTTRVTMLTTARTTTSSSICRVVDIGGWSSTGPCLMQMIVGALEGMASLLLMFEGTSSFALQGKEGMTPPTLRSREAYERELETYQTARAGAPPRPARSQESLETVVDHSGLLVDSQESGVLESLDMDGRAWLDQEPYQGCPVDEDGGVTTEDGLYYCREQIEHETRVKEAHRIQDANDPSQSGHHRRSIDTDRFREDIAAAQVQPLTPTVTRFTRQRSRSRHDGVRPLPPSPHYSSQPQDLQHRYHARKDLQRTPQYLSTSELDATLVRRPTRLPATLIDLHRGPADPRSPTYYTPAFNSYRRRSVSRTTTDTATSGSSPVAQMRMRASLLQQLVDAPVPSHLGMSSGQDKHERQHEGYRS